METSKLDMLQPGPTGTNLTEEPETAPDHPLRILVVGEVGPDQLVTGPTDGVIVAAFSDVDAASLARWQPDIVLSPLVAAGFDCVDLARILSEAQFTGRYRVAATDLPDPGVVRREIRASFPALDFDVL